MATRRNRIKCIANIPQRKKTNLASANATEELTDVPRKLEENVTTESNSVVNNGSQNLHQGEEFNKAVVESNETTIKDIKNNEVGLAVPEPPPKSTEICKPPIIRRRFVKPVITNLISRRNKQPNNADTIDINGGSSSNETSSKTINIGTPKVDEQQELPSASPKPIQIKSPEKVNFTLNETVIIPGNTNSLSEQPSNQDEVGAISVNQSTSTLGVHKLPLNFNVDVKSGSDSEYSAVSSHSPTKIINRSRIKAVPRFGQRRTSYSASESEDDSRKIGNRIRNDSMCSVTSGVHESSLNSIDVAPQKKEFSSVIQRKCKRTEQSRKLAEARREFQLKFGDSKPDKQKLTMIDLIFYNPTTNPMSQKKKRNLSTDDGKESFEDNNKHDNEDVVDDPTTEQKSDEENELPAPQIKIDPSGEIIVDEKSLVIESKEIKKGREELQKSEIVDGDFDTSYGVYKRVKRSKDWTQTETLRFYKALNTIGTDFTLMCDLFPKRSRRELKMKFKKEERMNRGLIDRAVMQPKSFDLTELKHEVEVEQREQAEIERHKYKTSNGKKEASTKKNVQGSRFAKACAIESTTDDKRPTRKSKLSKPTDEVVDLSRGIEMVLENDKKNQLFTTTTTTESTTDEILDEIFDLPSKSRRSKKKSKLKKRKIASSEEMPKKRKKSTTQKEKQSEIEPGSIMIVSSKGESGEPIYKLYMVTPGQENKPFDMSSINKLNKQNSDGMSLTNILTISEQKNNLILQEENMNTLEEKNVTIPAEGNNSPMRGENKIRILAQEKIVINGKYNAKGEENSFENPNVIIEAGGCVNSEKNVSLLENNQEGCSTKDQKNITVTNHSNVIPEEQIVISCENNITTVEHNYTNNGGKSMTTILSEENVNWENVVNALNETKTANKLSEALEVEKDNCTVEVKNGDIILPYNS